MKSGRNFSKIFAVFFMLAGVLLSSCETNRWFQSEDSLNAKIQTTWNKIRISSNPSILDEQWTFNNGTVYRVMGAPTAPADIDTGTYSVHTTISKAYLTISNFHRLADQLNAKWEILELSGGILAIATDNNGSSGLKQLEFQEK